MAQALNAAGELIELPPVSAADFAKGQARRAERDRRRSWVDRKAEAQAALIATDYLALPDRRPITDAEKSYREALRIIVRAEPIGFAPELPPR